MNRMLPELPAETLSSPADATRAPWGATRDGKIAFVKSLDQAIQFAFQPIVHAHSGTVYGFEALCRGHEALHFPNVKSLFDMAEERGLLMTLEATLRRRAIDAFARIPFAQDVQLFFNLDPRVMLIEGGLDQFTNGKLQDHGLPPSILHFELSELYDAAGDQEVINALTGLLRMSHRIVIDDFGTGYSGFKLLYAHQPEMVKIDRFFVANISADQKKKLFVRSIVELAHVLGVRVVAEGVETEREFLTCKEIGCDLVQGYFVARPTVDIAALAPRYAHIDEICLRDRRKPDQDKALIRSQIEVIPAVGIDDGLSTVFEMLRWNKERTFLPVVNDKGEPAGLILERDLKEMAYSTYGKDLLANPSYSRTVASLLTRCPVVDINSTAERIVESFSATDSALGVIVAEEFRYAGFLSAGAILRMVDEKNLALARDQNPLTKLPGNNMIADYVTQALDAAGTDIALVYFDFDNFKPFNDVYGFRQGDRAIALFGDLLRKRLAGADCFLGHIGGDDFFAGFRNRTPEETLEAVRDLIGRFREDVASFYESEDRARGFIECEDRYGEMRKFPLLSCSAAIMVLPAGEARCGIDALTAGIARLKKTAKASPTHLAMEIPREP